MSSITRGHNFGIADIVTAGTLNELVERATISNLVLADIAGGSGSQIAVFSAPTNGLGWVAAQYEPLRIQAGLGGGTFCEFKYVINTSEGQVALFSPLGLETKRFLYNNSSTAIVGSSIILKFPSAGNETIHCTAIIGPLNTSSSFLGPNLATSTTDVTKIEELYPRMPLRGLVPVNINPAADSSGRRGYFAHGSNDPSWRHQAADTNTDALAGFLLERTATGSNRYPGWHLGGPVWRT